MPVPTAARKRRYDDDDDEHQEESESSSGSKKPRNFLKAAQARLTEKLLSEAQAPLGRPPKTDEEKRETFQTLALLRSTDNLSYAECAQYFGVSKSTIGNWLADPLYNDICQELQQNARQQGFVSIGAVVQDAIATMYALMQSDPSGFVRFKAAETLLKYAGMELPPTASVTDDRKDVNAFLDQARARSALMPSVNINVTVQGSPSENQVPVVDALPVAEDPNSVFNQLEQQQLSVQQQAMLAEYSQPLGPGGKLPGSEERLAQKLKEFQSRSRDTGDRD